MRKERVLDILLYILSGVIAIAAVIGGDPALLIIGLYLILLLAYGLKAKGVPRKPLFDIKLMLKYNRAEFTLAIVSISCLVLSFYLYSYLCYRVPGPFLYKAPVFLLTLPAIYYLLYKDVFRLYIERGRRFFGFMRFLRPLFSFIIVMSFCVLFSFIVILIIMANVDVYVKMPVLAFYTPFLVWLLYKMFSLFMTKGPRSDVDKLLKESFNVSLSSIPFEVRIANVNSPLALVRRGRGYVFIPVYMSPFMPGRLFLSSNELKAVLEHEATHIYLDGETRWEEVRRREELKSVYLAEAGCLIIASISEMVSVALTTKPWALTSLEQVIKIILDVLDIVLASIVASVLMLFISFGYTGNILAARFREARADFIAVLKTGSPKAYKSALLRVYEMARKFSGSFKLSGSLLALCFASPEGLDEGAQAGRLEDLSLGRIARTRLKDVLWFPKNVHPSLPERLFVVDVAGALLSDGLRVEFRRPLEEGDYLRLAPSPDDLPRIKCLLRSIQDICEHRGRLKLCELEEAMSREGFKLSYAELFGALVFLDSRGIAAVRP